MVITKCHSTANERAAGKTADTGVMASFGGLDGHSQGTPFLGVRNFEQTVSIETALKKPDAYPTWPLYRLLDEDGQVVPGAELPDLSDAEWTDMYKAMLGLNELDDIFYGSQRQGRVSFYMTSYGEEAMQIGSAAALAPDDPVFAQYREAGILLWRGFGVQQYCDQMFSNERDLGKGRQMPIHIGSAKHHYQTISSPLSTQIPQAVGAAYALKADGKDNCAICYFGEGAASEGDFHAALNFASTLEVPVLFFCRNNGYAISTPTHEQYRGDGIVSRAIGYGIHAIRVDGNDIAAVYSATQQARELAIAESKPVLIEAMSYRVSHHSTSDDSSRYRSTEEISQWKENCDPIKRMKTFLIDKGLWSLTQESQQRSEERLAILKALETAEVADKPPLENLFTDVYANKPLHLVEQEEKLKMHMAKFPGKY